MIFDYLEYKAYLKFKIRENESQHGYKARLARAAQCPSSFISQVLHTHVELTMDHAFKLSRFWGHSQNERDYFLLLVSLSRAGSPDLKKHLNQQLDDLRKQSRDLTHRFQQPRISSSEQEWVYFTNWYLAAIHMALTIPEISTASALARKLNISHDQAEHGLETLLKMELVKKSNHGWVVTNKSIHLSKNSPASAVNHFIWRQRAATDIYANKEESLHYTGIHTLSKKDLAKIRAVLIEAIENAREIIEPSPEEELVCMNCDLFTVGGV